VLLVPQVPPVSLAPWDLLELQGEIFQSQVPLVLPVPLVKTDTAEPQEKLV